MIEYIIAFGGGVISGFAGGFAAGWLRRWDLKQEQVQIVARVDYAHERLDSLVNTVKGRRGNEIKAERKAALLESAPALMAALKAKDPQKLGAAILEHPELIDLAAKQFGVKL